jgi:hypothetical protein
LNFAPMNVGPMGEGGGGATHSRHHGRRKAFEFCFLGGGHSVDLRRKKETPGGYGKGKRKKVLLADRARHLTTVSRTTYKNTNPKTQDSQENFMFNSFFIFNAIGTLEFLKKFAVEFKSKLALN